MANYLDRQGLKVVLQAIKDNYASKKSVTDVDGKLKSLGISDISGLQDALTAAKMKASVVTSLPQTGENGVIYLVAVTGATGNNTYREYVWIESASKFEQLGDVAVDLSGYVKPGDYKALTIKTNGTVAATYKPDGAKEVNITAASVGAATPSDVTTAVSGKVDKVSGKQLSTNDYTTAEKTKLAGVATGATADGAIAVGATSDTAATEQGYATASVYALINGFLK